MAKLDNVYSKRVVFPTGKQTEFLNEIQEKFKLGTEDVANFVGVHARTIRDWKREKFSMSLDAVERLCKKFGIVLPGSVEIKEPFWYADKGSKKGWMTVSNRYGGLVCDPVYRKKKWYEWWEKEGKFKKHPIISICLPFTSPNESIYLAEIFGIILGDGGMTKSQLIITLNKDSDKDFINYVAKLFEEQFGIKPSLSGHKNANVTNIVISRKKLIEYLLKKGLKIGNKVRQQVAVPVWICRRKLFVKRCMRGLLDTDGCFYVDKHKYRDKIYYNCGINFTNRSLPLLNFFRDNLVKFGYHPTQKTKFSIFLRREEEIVKYFEEIGSSNPKHLNKFNKYFNNKLGGVG